SGGQSAAPRRAPPRRRAPADSGRPRAVPPTGPAAMGARHLLLLLVYLEPLGAKPKPAPNRSPKVRALNGTAAPAHETCLGYYDVSGQFDKMFECNNTDHRYCCGTCYLRFCCQFKGNRLEQRTCKNYQKPAWVKTVPPSPVPTGDAYDPSMDQTNAAVYITCGVIAFIIVLGVSAKVAYDKATQPPPEMNIHSQFDVISLCLSSSLCLSLFLSVSVSLSFCVDNTRMSGILTSQTEPYDLSFSRSFQSLSHLPPSYEAAVKADLNKFSSLKKLSAYSDKDMDDYYSRKRHLPDLAARGTLPLHVLKMAQDGPTPQLAPPQQQPPLQQSSQRQRPRRDRLHSHERLYSQDRLHSQDPLLSPDRMASIKRSGFHADRSMSRAISHTDVFVPSTPTLDRYKMAKVHAHPSSSGNAQHNSHSVNQTASKRQAFASRRTQTLEHFQYVPGHHHHYRTGSKTEVTV
uniref:Shisa N-terminal domain-containing protein n=1 Tax=Denticeps clupeoides TaxID=299321 RepID=A0AAY4BX48_9TELE